MTSPLTIAPDVHLVRSLPGAAGSSRVALDSLVLTGPEPVLVDTGSATGRDAWWRQVEEVVDPIDVRWIFLSHDDVDHHGNLVEALTRCPRATLVTTCQMVQRLGALAPLPLDRCRWVGDGEAFRAGDRELVAVRPPVYDSPTTRGLLDVASGTYWAVDCFGLAVPHLVDDAAELDADVWADGTHLFHRLLSPWASDVDPLRFQARIGRIAALDPKVVVSAHGPPVHRRDLPRALELLGELPGSPAGPTPGQVDLERAVAELARGHGAP